MTAPVAPMEARCSVCLDTGSKSKNLDGDLDCVACEAVQQRMALREYMAQYTGWPDKDALTWVACQFGQSQSAPVAAQPVEVAGQQPVAHLRFRAAQSWSGNGNHDVDYNEWLEVCEAHEVGDDKKSAFPVYAAPQPAAQPSGDVARDALKVARAALHTAEYTIKGREHTGFITNAIAVIDAAMAKEKA